MTDADALLRAVIAAPADDLPRLLLADYWEERNDPRGEFVRVQLRLAAMPQGPMWIDPESSLDMAELAHADYLRRRERELFHAASLSQMEWMGRAVHGVAVSGSEWDEHLPWFRRGFVECISCSLADWLAHGPAVVQAAPIREVIVPNLSVQYAGRPPACTVTLQNDFSRTYSIDEQRDRCNYALSDGTPLPRRLGGRLWCIIGEAQTGQAGGAMIGSDEPYRRASVELIAWAKSIDPRDPRRLSTPRRSSR